MHFNEYELQQKTLPTLKELRQELDVAFSLGNDLVQEEQVEGVNAKKKTIYKYLDEFVKEQSVLNQWAYATLQCWTTFKNHLETFGKGIDFEDFNENGVNRFIMHLRKTRELEEKTVQKQFNNLKWFLNWVSVKGIVKKNI